jgi:hypothetical protein
MIDKIVTIGFILLVLFYTIFYVTSLFVYMSDNDKSLIDKSIITFGSFLRFVDLICIILMIHYETSYEKLAIGHIVIICLIILCLFEITSFIIMILIMSGTVIESKETNILILSIFGINGIIATLLLCYHACKFYKRYVPLIIIGTIGIISLLGYVIYEKNKQIENNPLYFTIDWF